MKKYRKNNARILSLFIFPLFILVFALFLGSKTYAAKFTDGTWSQSGSPGTTTIVFTNTGALVAGDDIVLTFPATADVDAAGTDIACTGQTTPTRTNNNTDNSIRITLDGAIGGSTSITIAMDDGLTSYTSSTYGMESVAINTQDNADVLIDFGLALITNDNTTLVTASVPLFVNMAIDDTTIDLGTLSTASVKEADQTYTFNSNNNTGITVQITADNNLNDASSNTINDVTDGTVTAGSEEYGISVDNTSVGFIIAGSFAPNDRLIPQDATTIASSSASISNVTFDLNYKASISGTTIAGDYDQVVTVTVATNA